MSQNAIIGEAYGTDLPETSVPKDELDNERNLAKFSKTKEFQRLKQHLEDRIEYYQGFLPDGRPIDSVTKGDREGSWVIANAIIGELKFIINRYEAAQEVIKNVGK